MLDVDVIYTPLRHIAYRKIGEQMVLVHTLDNTIVSLNSTATAIWERLDGSTSLQRIAEEIESLFEVCFKEAAQDTEEFLTYLEQRGFVSCVSKGDKNP